jgi:hypothetical protein
MNPLLATFTRGVLVFGLVWAASGSAYAAYWAAVVHDALTLALLN